MQSFFGGWFGQFLGNQKIAGITVGDVFNIHLAAKAFDVVEQYNLHDNEELGTREQVLGSFSLFLIRYFSFQNLYRFFQLRVFLGFSVFLGSFNFKIGF